MTNQMLEWLPQPGKPHNRIADRGSVRYHVHRYHGKLYSVSKRVRGKLTAHWIPSINEVVEGDPSRQACITWAEADAKRLAVRRRKAQPQGGG